MLPAHAGMVPSDTSGKTVVPGAPCTRGDGPLDPQTRPVNMLCSSRTRGRFRGWEVRRGGGGVLAAHAGVDQGGKEGGGNA